MYLLANPLRGILPLIVNNEIDMRHRIVPKYDTVAHLFNYIVDHHVMVHPVYWPVSYILN